MLLRSYLCVVLSVISSVVCIAILPSGADALTPFPKETRSSPAANPRTLTKENPTNARASLDRILEAAIAYCFSYKGALKPLFYSEGEARQHKPWECFVTPEAGGKSDVLVQRVKRLGVTLVGKTWFNYPNTVKLPEKFVYVEIETVKWLTKKRVKVEVTFNRDFNSETSTAAYGTLFIDYSRAGWVVDKKNSEIRIGE